MIDPEKLKRDLAYDAAAVRVLLDTYKEYADLPFGDDLMSEGALTFILDEAKVRLFHYSDAEKEALQSAMPLLQEGISWEAVIAQLERDARQAVLLQTKIRDVSRSQIRASLKRLKNSLHAVQAALKDVRAGLLQEWLDFDSSKLGQICEAARNFATEDEDYAGLLEMYGSRESCLSVVDRLLCESHSASVVTTFIGFAFIADAEPEPQRGRNKKRGLEYFLRNCAYTYFEATGRHPTRHVTTYGTEEAYDTEEVKSGAETGAFHDFVAAALAPISSHFGDPAIDHSVRKARELFYEGVPDK